MNRHKQAPSDFFVGAHWGNAFRAQVVDNIPAMPVVISRRFDCASERIRALRTPHMLAEVFDVNALATILLFSIVTVGAAAGGKPHAGGEARATPQDEEPSLTATAAMGPRPDLSGRTRFGKASFYARKFVGREMADGIKMDPQGDDAASKTLPLGTTARVTNMETGRSAVVTIRDRGPYVKGRIVDLSASTAQKIGITHGVAKVKVAPISVPLPDGSTKRSFATPDAILRTAPLARGSLR